MNKTYIIVSIILVLGVLGYAGINNYQKQVELKAEQEEQARKEAIYQDCKKEAEISAKALLGQKVKLMKERRIDYFTYEQAYNSGLYLTADYDRYFKQCVEGY